MELSPKYIKDNESGVDEPVEYSPDNPGLKKLLVYLQALTGFGFIAVRLEDLDSQTVSQEVKNGIKLDTITVEISSFDSIRELQSLSGKDGVIILTFASMPEEDLSRIFTILNQNRDILAASWPKIAVLLTRDQLKIYIQSAPDLYSRSMRITI